jgi:hypothetical protein
MLQSSHALTAVGSGTACTSSSYATRSLSWGLVGSASTPTLPGRHLGAASAPSKGLQMKVRGRRRGGKRKYAAMNCFEEVDVCYVRKRF